MSEHPSVPVESGDTTSYRDAIKRTLRSLTWEFDERPERLDKFADGLAAVRDAEMERLRAMVQSLLSDQRVETALRPLVDNVPYDLAGPGLLAERAAQKIQRLLAAVGCLTRELVENEEGQQ